MSSSRWEATNSDFPHRLLVLCDPTTTSVFFWNQMILVISTSLNSQSRSFLMAKHVQEQFAGKSIDVELIDLRNEQLPRCDGESCYGHPAVNKMSEKIRQAQGVVLATPVYNYSICSEAKNLVELTGKAWSDSVAGFLCSAGGQGSYMSIMNLANSLMLDFRTLILPRFVYATGEAFGEQHITDDHLIDRLNLFSDEMNRVTEALKA